MPNRPLRTASEYDSLFLTLSTFPINKLQIYILASKGEERRSAVLKKLPVLDKEINVPARIVSNGPLRFKTPRRASKLASEHPRAFHELVRAPPPSPHPLSLSLSLSLSLVLSRGYKTRARTSESPEANRREKELAGTHLCATAVPPAGVPAGPASAAIAAPRGATPPGRIICLSAEHSPGFASSPPRG
jgi:hypothetical protein